MQKSGTTTQMSNDKNWVFDFTFIAEENFVQKKGEEDYPKNKNPNNFQKNKLY